MRYLLSVIWLLLSLCLQSQQNGVTVGEYNILGDKQATEIQFTENYIFFKSDRQRWISDGTQDNTFPLQITSDEIEVRGEIDKLVFFTDGDNLWRSNGTPEGTFMISPDDLSAGYKQVSNVIEFKGRAWFVGSEDDIQYFYSSYY